mgnify:CR=1 FL=1|jgi:hypothetical protein
MKTINIYICIMLLAIIFLFSYISSRDNSLGYNKEGIDETLDETLDDSDTLGFSNTDIGYDDEISSAETNESMDAANSNDTSTIMEDSNYSNILEYNNNLIANENEKIDKANENNLNSIDGITKTNVPPGQEDLYVLKSSTIAPVCPKCDKGPCCKEKKPPPCPPCARCPEPSFECKKVPNYSSPNVSQYAPRPVLANFSQFGM